QDCETKLKSNVADPQKSPRKKTANPLDINPIPNSLFRRWNPVASEANAEHYTILLFRRQQATSELQAISLRVDFLHTYRQTTAFSNRATCLPHLRLTRTIRGGFCTIFRVTLP